MKKQILYIHGGETFNTYKEYLDFLKNLNIDSLDYFKKIKWIDTLEKKLGEDFEVISPRMPNNLNAKYIEWKIYFEKLLPLLNNEIILIGHSLGGIFLAKYLSENIINKKVLGLFLVASPFDDAESEYSLADFALNNDLNYIEKQITNEKIYFLHSEDDAVVPFVDMLKYKKLLPNANYVVLKDRQHFNQSDFLELEELLLKLKQD